MLAISSESDCRLCTLGTVSRRRGLQRHKSPSERRLSAAAEQQDIALQYSLDEMEHVNKAARDCLYQVVNRREQAAANEAECEVVNTNFVRPSLLSKPQLDAVPKCGGTSQRLDNVRECLSSAHYSSDIPVCERKSAPKVHVKQELGILFLLSLPRKQVPLHNLTESSAVLTRSISGLVTASVYAAGGMIQHAISY